MEQSRSAVKFVFVEPETSLLLSPEHEIVISYAN
jgi:hypothetical protein